jgi:hypothetical protein
MTKLSQSAPRPASSRRSPAYPRALGVAAALIVAACGGAVSDPIPAQQRSGPSGTGGTPFAPAPESDGGPNTDEPGGSGGGPSNPVAFPIGAGGSNGGAVPPSFDHTPGSGGGLIAAYPDSGAHAQSDAAAAPVPAPPVIVVAQASGPTGSGGGGIAAPFEPAVPEPADAGRAPVDSGVSAVDGAEPSAGD